MVRLENILKISLQDVLKMSWRRLEGALNRSWRRLEDVLKTYDQNKYNWSWPKRLKDVLKSSFEEVRLRRTYSSWWRHPDDVFWRRRRKTSSGRLHQNKCLLGGLPFLIIFLSGTEKVIYFSVFSPKQSILPLNFSASSLITEWKS